MTIDVWTKRRQRLAAALRAPLFTAAAGSLALRVTATGMGIVTAILLARLLGAAGYGAYAYAMALIALLGIPALLGLDKILIRYTAAYQARSSWDLMHGLIRWANRTCLLASVAVVVIAILVAWAVAGRVDDHMLVAFCTALLLVPLVALRRLRQATLRGLHHVVVAHLPETLVQPLVLVVLVVGAYLLVASPLRAPWVVAMIILAASAAFLVGAFLLQRKLPPKVREVAPAYRTKEWWRASIPMVLIGGVYVVNARTDMIMLGAISDGVAVGIYAVANRTADLIVFVLTAVNAALAPTIAKLHALGKTAQLQRIVTKSARAVLFLTIPLAFSLIAFGHWFLLLFGPEFAGGRNALVILSLGRLFNASMGSAGIILVMTGHGGLAAAGVAISAVVNIALNAALIPHWGIEGAATATATSTIIWNLLLALWVYRKLGIHSTALGQIRLRTTR